MRFRVFYGGRGSAKSWQFARALLVHGTQRPLRVLCVREYQSSIRESVHAVLVAQIMALALSGFYTIERDRIFAPNGTEFIFKGLKRDVHSIKSTEGIDICWVNEAEAVSKKSWEALTPTIRGSRLERAEIWVEFNPREADDPTYVKFVTEPPDPALEPSVIRHVTYRDNPFMPAVLRAEQESLFRADPEAHENVWGGKPMTRSHAQIMADKCIVQEFDSLTLDGRDGPYFGADWGFSQDPTVLLRCWLHDSRLYVDYERSGIKWDNDQIAREFKSVKGTAERVIRGDSARPETIHELCKRGLRVEGAEKWQGSVEDGIAFLRSFTEIVIHPRCTGLVNERLLYRYKVDPRTNDVTRDIIDKHNHRWDALRYALAPLIRRSRRVGLVSV